MNDKEDDYISYNLTSIVKAIQNCKTAQDLCNVLVPIQMEIKEEEFDLSNTKTGKDMKKNWQIVLSNELAELNKEKEKLK